MAFHSNRLRLFGMERQEGGGATYTLEEIRHEMAEHDEAHEGAAEGAAAAAESAERF